MGIRGKDGLTGCEHDDDAFYAELERWVLELTAEEEEDDVLAFRTSGYSGSNFVGVNQGGLDPVRPYASLRWSPCAKTSGNGGTGVFIPQIVNYSSPPRTPEKAKKGKGRPKSLVDPKLDTRISLGKIGAK